MKYNLSIRGVLFDDWEIILILIKVECEDLYA